MRIERDVWLGIRQRLEEAYPDEGCGFLLGDREGQEVHVKRAAPVNNRRRSDGAAARRYLISSDDYRDAERSLKGSALLIVGTYHSHPDVAAEPSGYDREHAWPWYQYLIVSVTRGHSQEARVWELAEDRSHFRENPLRIEES